MLIAVPIAFILIAAGVGFFVRMPVVPTKAGLAVLAIALFTQIAGIYWTGTDSIWTRGMVVLALVLGLCLFAAYLGSARRGNFRIQHWNDPVERLFIGTWTAGTAFLLLIAQRVFPELHVIWVPLGVLNVALLLFDLFAVSLATGEIAAGKRHLELDGTILLPVLSLQAVSLQLHEAFGAQEYLAYRVLVLLGVIFYIIGIGVLFLRYRQQKRKRGHGGAAADRLIYAAVAITGWAALRSSVFPPGLLIGIWGVAALLLLWIEAVATVRVLRGVRNTSDMPWSGTIAWGIFMGFTLQSEKLFEQYAWEIINVLHEWTIIFGVWVVVIFMFFDTVRFIAFFIRTKSAYRKHLS
ncbi:hypothetical protein [Saccharibacillus sacchari]|uniref:Uncharacterized protein n=1 Tax=Saccharibacillus sacchari TaxID=456493 RepID=A0ACC6PFM0_9BACL